MNKTILITVIFCGFLFTLGWYFHYKALKYVKKYDLLLYSGLGPIILSRKIKQIPEPGRTYAKISITILGLTPVAFVLTLILFKIFGLL